MNRLRGGPHITGKAAAEHAKHAPGWHHILWIANEANPG